MGAHRKPPARRDRMRLARNGLPSRWTSLLSLAGAGVALAGLIATATIAWNVRGADDSDVAALTAGSTAGPEEGGAILTTELRPTDAAGSASAAAEARAVVLRLRGGRVCFTLSWYGMAPPRIVELRVRDAGSEGPLTVVLWSGALPETLTGATGCVRLLEAHAKTIGAADAEHQLVLRSSSAGAPMRGTLRAAATAPDLFRNLRGPLVAEAAGGQQAGTAGDENARATAQLSAVVDRVDFVITWTDLTAPTAGQVQGGPPGTEPLAPLFAAPGGLPATLTGVAGSIGDQDRRTVGSIRRQPGRFSVRLDNVPHPDGAAAGRLAARDGSAAGGQ